MRTLICCLALFLGIANAFSQATKEKVFNHVSLSEFKQLMDSLQGEVIVDLRTPDELKQGKIPGAIVIDFFGPDFEPLIEALDRDKVYLLYCASGGRSGETLDLMSNMGFKRVYELEQGFREWVKAKMPVDRKR